MHQAQCISRRCWHSLSLALWAVCMVHSACNAHMDMAASTLFDHLALLLSLLHRAHHQHLPQLPARRPSELCRISKRQKRINRIYGGCLSHKVVRERIVRAFLVEEQKIVKKVCLRAATAASATFNTTAQVLKLQKAKK